MEPRIAILFPLLIFTMAAGYAQPNRSAIWISINHDHAGGVMMFFGNVPGATYGIDEELGEMEAPPASPAFDARWVNNAGRRGPSIGLGLLTYDYIPCPLNSAQKDTFTILLSDGFEPSNRWTFAWADSAELSLNADSLFLFDPSHPDRPVNMFRQREYVVDNPESPARFRIYKYGKCPCIVAEQLLQSPGSGDGNFPFIRVTP